MKIWAMAVTFIFAGGLFAADTVAEKVAEPAEKPAEMEEEAPAWLEGGFDIDFFSAYVFRNAVMNDDLVMQPCVWFDVTRFEPFWLGASVWQNWNLTTRQRGEGIPTEMNETDFNVHLGASLWESDDEEYSFDLELGHDWYTYRYDCHNANEFYLRAEFNNPFMGVYGQYSQAYWPENGCHFEVGLAQEWNMAEVFDSERDWLKRLTAGIDWNVNFGSGKYFSNYLWGMLPDKYDEESEEWSERYMSNGIGGTTVKGMIAYQLFEHCTLGIVVAYTGLLSGEARDVMEYYGSRSTYKDIAWGGIQAKFDF